MKISFRLKIERMVMEEEQILQLKGLKGGEGFGNLKIL